MVPSFGNDDDELAFHTQLAKGVLLLAPIVAAILIFGRPPTYGKLQQQQQQQKGRNQQQQQPSSTKTTSTPSSSSLTSSSKITWTWLGPLVPSWIAWMIFESPCLLWVAVCLAWRRNGSDDVNDGLRDMPLGNKLLLTWFVIHYIYRSIIYPLQQSTTSRTPLGVALMAWSYCMTNGYLQSRPLTAPVAGTEATSASASLGKNNSTEMGIGTDIDAYTPTFVIGMVLCMLGFSIVYTSDQTLLRLKNMKSTKTKTTTKSPTGEQSATTSRQHRYSIPHGGLFEYISAPHYFGEIIEWTGFCMATGGTWASFSFVVWTVANLVPRAIATHAWYQHTFSAEDPTMLAARNKKNEDSETNLHLEVYPPNRKAVIPFFL